MTLQFLYAIIVTVGILTTEGNMPDKEMEAQVQACESGGRVERSRDLTIWQAVTMSIVAILAVAVGTIYGTILF